nr:hypothetical protein CFP56_14281 [Quercus suber]
MFSLLNSSKHLLYKFTEVWGLRQNTTIGRSKFEAVHQTWQVPHYLLGVGVPNSLHISKHTIGDLTISQMHNR